jgi:Bacterial CdiA-CT RNAse A domain
VNGPGNGNQAVIRVTGAPQAPPPTYARGAVRPAAPLLPLPPDSVAAPRLAPLPAPAPGAVRHTASGPAVALRTSPAAAARIAAGLHQVHSVDGVTLAYPSQDLRAIESADPRVHGQTHGLTEHVGSDLAANVRRLEAQPQIRAAGSYTDEARAQLATDRTIANPANQRAVGAFLADPERLKTALLRVDVGLTVGTTTTRADLDAGKPALIPGRTATVVLIKDRTFPEGYRILTTYPDTRPAEVDARGNRQQ